MIDIGRVCIKTAGRDSGKRCVIVEEIDGTFVLIDGETRRRKCNRAHLEPTDETVQIEQGADHETVAEALGIEAKKAVSKKAGERPRTRRKIKEQPQKKPAARPVKVKDAAADEAKPAQKKSPASPKAVKGTVQKTKES